MSSQVNLLAKLKPDEKAAVAQPGCNWILRILDVWFSLRSFIASAHASDLCHIMIIHRVFMMHHHACFKHQAAHLDPRTCQGSPPGNVLHTG
jgi:hypothetical protein